MKMKTITLYELNSLVRQTIEIGLPKSYWVEAEISELRENGGHCYLELIEKDKRYNTPIAKASARCWRQTWGMVKPYFENTTGQQLRAGMKVLIEVYAQFHEAYGFSWIISDIDPNYTLGDMARKRQEIIKRLKEEGVFDLNKQLDLPLFSQRIAVISSKSAAGYGDFANQLYGNQYGYYFEAELFAATMQGEDVERSIIKALNAINDRCDDFDCVVIIRGGGATSDMSGFDALELAENVANFPLPIITGIGHDRDECILDMVSHTRVKTPTAAAALLIDNLHTAERRIDDARQRIANLTSRKMEVEKLRLSRLAERLPALFGSVKDKQEARLDILQERLFRLAEIRLSNCENIVGQLEKKISLTAEHLLMVEKHRLELLEGRAQNLDPQLLLRRGYSITLVGGKALRDPSQVKQGDKIETRLEKGTITSIID
ncbi:MAG: exodeoxyribonuclease VII large subunit [Prevotellaceae bacterium]|nr:exodeoxyribonuclease VII large subunit [Prevotellaceae bacterium]